MSDVVDTSSKSGLGSYLVSTVTTLVWRVGSLAFGLGAVVATLLYFKQDSMLYFPEIGGIARRPGRNPRWYRSPSEYQIAFENHQIACADGVSIHAWLMMRDPDHANQVPTLIFFHGNAGNIGLRLPNALQMRQYLNVNVLLVEYRGYGDSDSVAPNEKGLKLDESKASSTEEEGEEEEAKASGDDSSKDGDSVDEKNDADESKKAEASAGEDDAVDEEEELDEYEYEEDEEYYDDEEE